VSGSTTLSVHLFYRETVEPAREHIEQLHAMTLLFA